MINIDVLRRQLESVCSELGWIDDETVCERLGDHFTNLALDDVLRTLDQQRSPNGPVSANAYWLLRINTEAVRASLVR